MAAIHDLINRVSDEELRKGLEAEVNKISKRKKFGLVFEEHRPECTPLYKVPVTVGKKVALKSGHIADLYTVLAINDGIASCVNLDTKEPIHVPVDELVVSVEFGEPIYPCLQYVDSVCNAPNNDLWHTLIEADNYHALQLLEYLYGKKVDCIYIDPPYNTGAKDWKYNNDYIDSSDSYRHSKWLSMMEKRLLLSKKLLNPETGVLIVTIDEHEVHHLRTLLEQIFPEAFIQMATIVINQKGVAQGRLARVEEYAIYVFMRNAFVASFHDDLLNVVKDTARFKTPRWEWLLRGGNNSQRADRPNMFYPIYIDPEKKIIKGVGDVLPLPYMPDLTYADDMTVAWPIRTDGSLGHWQLQPSTFLELLEKGYVKLGGFDKKRKTWTILYVNKGTRKRIDEGEIVITGRDEVTGSVNIAYKNREAKMFNVKTVWHRALHDSGIYGSTLLTNIIGRDSKFDFPKSIYSTKDAIANVVRDKPNALVLDFFAGSGTTLNAINLLNVEDNGNRRCILVTNNEVSLDEEKKLAKQSIFRNDPKWEQFGICRSITWPRTKYTINGRRDDGTVLAGEYVLSKTEKIRKKRVYKKIDFINAEELKSLKIKKNFVEMFGTTRVPASLVKADTHYIVSEKYPVTVLFDKEYSEEWLSELEDKDNITEIYIVASNDKEYKELVERAEAVLGDIIKEENIRRPISAGFEANAIYFKLDFLDKTAVALGKQFKELLSVLWMKAGAYGKCPIIEGEIKEDYLIFEPNKMAVLIKEAAFKDFQTDLKDHPAIQTVYIVTDYEAGFRTMKNNLNVQNTYQLYKDYLDNFRINQRR